MKNARLFQMLYILLEKKAATAPELAEKLEVSVRTVYRDVEALSMAGVPVYATPGKGGGISLMKNYAFDKALLSDDEQNQILFAIQSLSAADLNADALLSKLGGLFQKPETQWISVDFSRWGFNRLDKARFEQIKQAIIKKKVLKIRYCGSSGKISDREIKPFQLVYKDKSWYLQSFCRKAEAYRLFKVSRMIEIADSGERFSDAFPDAPTVDIDMPVMTDTVSVKLAFLPEAAFRVYDEFYRALVTELPDGTLLVTAKMPEDEWVMPYLFSFGPAVTVLSPENLKKQMADYAKTVFEHHSS